MASKQEEPKMSITRVNHFGFINFAVIDNASGTELVRFDTYFDAVEFIMFCDDIVFEDIK